MNSLRKNILYTLQEVMNHQQDLFFEVEIGERNKDIGT